MTERKKKILFIMVAMGDGIFTYIVDLTNKLLNKYDMYIAYTLQRQTPAIYKEYFYPRIHLMKVENFARFINPTKNFKAMLEMKKIKKEIKLDIIHLHPSKAGAIGCVIVNEKKNLIFYAPHAYSFLIKNHSKPKRMIFKTIETLFAKTNGTTINYSKGEHEATLKLTKKVEHVNNGIKTGDDEMVERAFDDMLSEYNTKVMGHRYSTIYLKTIRGDKLTDVISFPANEMAVAA
ncbi:glycosyltransferase [Hungatella effluvii]|uniref:glycosyltransferase n=1 Tax=Hungatella effluvii TaxID=1096246 RepID=UPI0022E84BA9|nr:glycosyltransferase [Hungatella effluvii]